MKDEPTAVTLRIVLEKPTAGVDFGLQKGHGSDYEVVAKQRSKGGDLEFEFTVTAKIGRNDDLPSFAGPFVRFRRRAICLHRHRYLCRPDEHAMESPAEDTFERNYLGHAAFRESPGCSYSRHRKGWRAKLRL